MALCDEEDELWKCEKHPTKCRRAGICPNCLSERLSSLCPHSAAAAAAIPPGEPKFQKSRSLNVPFLRSKFSGNDSSGGKWWDLRRQKSKKTEEERERESASALMMMMMRSQSFGVEKNGKSCLGKSRRWSFLSPMNIFRRS